MYYLYLMSYNTKFQDIANEIDLLMQAFSHTKKDIGYGYRRTFDNKIRFDLIDYKRHDTFFLRVWRGVWLAKKYPLLKGLFDSISKVIAKLEITNKETLYKKDIAWLLSLLDQTSFEAYRPHM